MAIQAYSLAGVACLKPVGVVYNNDDGLYIIMGNTIEECTNIDLDDVPLNDIEVLYLSPLSLKKQQEQMVKSWTPDDYAYHNKQMNQAMEEDLSSSVENFFTP